MGEVLTQHKSHGAGRSPRSAPRRLHNLPAAALTEMAVRGGEGKLADSGALVVTTGEHTGRSPEDKFIVRDERSADEVWWGEVNHPLSVEQFDGLYERVRAHLAEQTVYVQDLIVCADLRYRYRVRHGS